MGEVFNQLVTHVKIDDRLAKENYVSYEDMACWNLDEDEDEEDIDYDSDDE
jgi:hypothetical protein